MMKKSVIVTLGFALFAAAGLPAAAQTTSSVSKA